MPADPFRKCRECGHVYASAADLLAEHVELVEQINQEASPDDLLMVAQTDPQKIDVCPGCAPGYRGGIQAPRRVWFMAHEVEPIPGEDYSRVPRTKAQPDQP